MEKKAIRAKQRARKLLVQALYQWLMTEQDLFEIETQFRMFNKLEKIDVDYFCRLLYEIPKEYVHIEKQIEPFLDRPTQELNPIERTILRIGAFELLYCLEMPYKVVLDEAISLTKEFGSQDGYKYVNGVLNNLAKKIRTVEIGLEKKHERIRPH